MPLRALVAKTNRFLDSSMFVSSSFVYEINAILTELMANIEFIYIEKHFPESP